MRVVLEEIKRDKAEKERRNRVKEEHLDEEYVYSCDYSKAQLAGPLPPADKRMGRSLLS